MSYFPPSIDDVTGAMITVDYAHHEVHEGSLFSMVNYQTLVDPVTYKWSFVAPNTTTRMHIVFAASSSGPVIWSLYENPTTLAAGSAWTARNHERNSVAAATLTGAYGVTTAADGTLIAQEIVGSAGGGGPQASVFGGSARGLDEWILKQNEEYVVTCVTNGADADVTLNAVWYEKS